MAILSARLELQVARPDALPGARNRARKRLDEARQLCGESPILDLEELDYSPTPTSNANASAVDALPRLHTAWEHYAVGCWLMHHGLFAAAEQQFAASIAQQPNDFWANFQQTRCNFELEHFEQALISATVCVALAPHRAECFFNRALCQESLGHYEESLADFGQSLERDSNFVGASLERGLLLAQLQRFPQAMADLKSALAHGGRAEEIYYQMARLQMAQHDHRGALNYVGKSLAANPTYPASLALQDELGAQSP
jgi:tetratricopeptide (TPR) repeat protein